MSLAKLTSISTQTLSLLLERQRLQTLPSYSTDAPPSQPNNLHLTQITQNLNSLRSGILALEAKEGRSDAVSLLRNQHERMRAMLGAGEDDGVVSLEPERPPAQPKLIPSPPAEPPYTPYADDPEAGPEDMLQTQRLLMDQQDSQLDMLSHSINRQRDLSLQINDELEVHTGLLEELDTDLGHTDSLLSGARRRLDRVAKGAKNNGSTVTIGALILILLILIIVFKT
ncbi:t-SNARE coiled-coil-like proteiny domain-containing protein [Mycena venus]|uniref:t-SNARE coiled-coil-like proteiny domain-containing protein n=1 Tax=Mycena venus TaxID=2733690 RepID=A0A8H6Z278_9AGAR|nr:t-SNARE coiled-coil-like proteiny domain-containing protein [Mycena venus]